MTVRFLHAADVHLGYEQYGLSERYDDFARAFERLVDDAIARRVHAVLLAGDLFHKRVIQPRTLLQATALLGRLREAGICVLAVQGNHDRPYRQEGFSWLDYLAEAGYWALLTPYYEAGEMILDAWEPESKQGAYLDLPEGVRIIGLPYSGATTPRLVADLARALNNAPKPRPAYTVLMMHAGLQGILDNYGASLSRAHLEALRPHIDYMAFGHIHKPFEQDGWIYNPGSLETTNITELQWPERGYYYVEIDPRRDPPHRVERIIARRRPFISLPFSVDAYETPQALEQALGAFLTQQRTSAPKPQEGLRPDEARPVVELRLMGTLPFSRAELQIPLLQEMVAQAFDALLCNVRDQTVPREFEIRSNEQLNREELERFVLRELVEREPRHRAFSQSWTEMIRRIKQLSLSGAAPQEIIAELRAFRQYLAEAEEDEDLGEDMGETDEC
ncbi:MAG: DNA repair exonuclease [Chloroflexi bacterium]|nr:DNA repair exonuclease [Chloroflexota bacterium]